jgi:hypothetical protein
MHVLLEPGSMSLAAVASRIALHAFRASIQKPLAIRTIRRALTVWQAGMTLLSAVGQHQTASTVP